MKHPIQEGGFCRNAYRVYLFVMVSMLLVTLLTAPALAAGDMWGLADKIIKDVYAQIVKISTALAGLMSAVAVIGAKLSNNQHKVDQAWDWLRRIWIAWCVVNGIGAFVAYVAPFFSGYATLSPSGS